MPRVIAVEREAVEAYPAAWRPMPELLGGALAMALGAETADVVLGVGTSLGQRHDMVRDCARRDAAGVAAVAA